MNSHPKSSTSQTLSGTQHSAGVLERVLNCWELAGCVQPAQPVGVSAFPLFLMFPFRQANFFSLSILLLILYLSVGAEIGISSASFL